jgi:hypothetical protein
VQPNVRTIARPYDVRYLSLSTTPQRKSSEVV